MNSVGRVAAIFVGVLPSDACSSSKEHRPLAEREAAHVHVSRYSFLEPGPAQTRHPGVFRILPLRLTAGMNRVILYG
jgi:hypothetical protein